MDIKALAKEVSDLAANYGTLAKLSALVNLDDAGNFHINLPADGSFTVRQGDRARVEVDNAGDVALVGAEQVFITCNWGEVAINPKGVTIADKDGTPMLWFRPDGDILLSGNIVWPDDAKAKEK